VVQVAARKLQASARMRPLFLPDAFIFHPLNKIEKPGEGASLPGLI
jgi:hypothetical protein